MTKIKICGLRTVADVAIVNEFNPEYIGFIFVKGRKRYIEPETALKLKAGLNKGIQAVGVFVNEDVNEVARLAQNNVIDVIQLHGTEDNDYISELRRLTDKTIIKAIRIDTEDDLKLAHACQADIVLFDCGQGGTGKTFDWNLVKSFNKPFFLAGGLSAENIAEAIDLLNPTGVDVSSGVETEGSKDRDKVERFINNVRNGDK